MINNVGPPTATPSPRAMKTFCSVVCLRHWDIIFASTLSMRNQSVRAWACHDSYDVLALELYMQIYIYEIFDVSSFFLNSCHEWRSGLQVARVRRRRLRHWGALQLHYLKFWRKRCFVLTRTKKITQVLFCITDGTPMMLLKKKILNAKIACPLSHCNFSMQIHANNKFVTRVKDLKFALLTEWLLKHSQYFFMAR